MKLKMNTKAAIAGYKVAKFCRNISIAPIVILLPCIVLTNDDRIINKWAVLPSLVFLVLFAWGFWRTGGFEDEK